LREILFRVHRNVRGALLEMPNAPEEFDYRSWSKTQWMVFQKNGDNRVVVDEGVNPINMIRWNPAPA